MHVMYSVFFLWLTLAEKRQYLDFEREKTQRKMSKMYMRFLKIIPVIFGFLYTTEKRTRKIV